MVDSDTKWEVKAMFMGEFNHTIDPKNRVIVPAKFREGLGEKFVVSAGLDGCLYLMKNEDWESFAESLNELPINKESRQLVRFFMRNAQECEPDKQGRILLGEDLIRFAGIKKDVVVVGNGEHIEIWSKERLDGETPEESMEDIVEKLSTEYGLKF